MRVAKLPQSDVVVTGRPSPQLSDSEICWKRVQIELRLDTRR